VASSSPAARRRKPPIAGGLGKTLLTLLALAGTLGGWAKLSAEGAGESQPEPTVTPLVLALPPVPTVIPAPDDLQTTVVNAAPTAAPPALRRVSAPAASSASSSSSSRPSSSASTRSSG
jgi:hypothetical protein